MPTVDQLKPAFQNLLRPPMRLPAQDGLMANQATFATLALSAIKCDAGVKDFGAMVEGHGGILDRIDSICFAAPVFFHLTRYFFVP
jgi:predicted CDP-diglyceride synthetase/phosphatidate cytidylyltransferase